MHACMRSPEGQDFWSIGMYKEIVPLKKIVVTDNFADKDGNIIPGSDYGMEGDWSNLLITITFEETENGKTKMTLLHEGLPEGKMSDQTAEGWNSSLDKLDESFA